MPLTAETTNDVTKAESTHRVQTPANDCHLFYWKFIGITIVNKESFKNSWIQIMVWIITKINPLFLRPRPTPPKNFIKIHNFLSNIADRKTDRHNLFALAEITSK